MKMTSIYNAKYRYQLKLMSIFCCSIALSACSATSGLTSTSQSDALNELTRIDFACEQQVKQRENALEASSNPGAYMALANHAERCIDGISFFPKHPDNQTAMRFNALSVLNFIKAGEMQEAKQSLSQFRQRFPRQDLVMPDYTSFVDTAIALLARDGLTERQLSLLNINSTLKSELARQQYWSAN
jgi:hypothetical protein